MDNPKRQQATIAGIQFASTQPDGYKITMQDGTILWVPDDTENSDYQRVQAWIDAGNVVTTAP